MLVHICIAAALQATQLNSGSTKPSDVQPLEILSASSQRASRRAWPKVESGTVDFKTPLRNFELSQSMDRPCPLA